MAGRNQDYLAAITGAKDGVEVTYAKVTIATTDDDVAWSTAFSWLSELAEDIGDKVTLVLSQQGRGVRSHAFGDRIH